MTMAKELNLEKIIKNTMLQKLQDERKLCLVLDLDQTLIHTKCLNKLSAQQIQSLSHQADIYGWEAKGVKYFTKLRPFVRQFLKQACEIFELYVYTMGSLDYGLNMVKFLDPQGVYIGSRVIAREDCTIEGEKGLDVVPVHESGVLILDDTDSVWKKNLGNVIVIEKYDYFSPTGRDESEDEGELSCALSVLTALHNAYFEWYDLHGEGDVRELIQSYWEEDINNDEGQQQVGTWTCSSDMVFGNKMRVDDECPSQGVTKKQRLTY